MLPLTATTSGSAATGVNDEAGRDGGLTVLLSRRHPHGRAVLGRQGLRLVTLPIRSLVHGVHGPTWSENSSGLSEHRGAITRDGNSHIRGQLCEVAWTYQHRPSLGPTIRERQAGARPATTARFWRAQNRLSKRFAALAARKNVKSVVAAAIARELAGFLWAEMTAAD
jgi:hypothetical protein